MSFKIARFLAWRYLSGVNQNQRVNIVSKVCFLSIFVGTLCLALQIFVSEGFDRALTSKMQSIYPHLVLEAPIDQTFDYTVMNKKLLFQFNDRIIFTAPSHTKRVVIRPIDSSTPSAVVLKAVDPLLESKVSSLTQKLAQQTTLEKALKPNSIIIGKRLADYYDLEIGDKCTLLFTQEDELTTEKSSFESTAVTVGNIMDTGIIQYDKYTILCSLSTLETALHEDALTQIGIKLKPGTDDETIAEELRAAFSCEVNSWKTLYPALVSATKLEKYVMFLLLILMTFIASANIIALIIMQITRKKTDIALLKTLGMEHSTIVMLFTLMGSMIVSIAAFAGIVGALVIGILFQYYPFIKLPDAYFCSHLPVHIELPTALFIFLTVVVIGTLSSWFSAHSTGNIKSTQTLRFER